MCEMIVRQHFVQFWITNEIFIIPEQFGFLKRKSYLSQPLPLFKYCSCGTSQKLLIDPKIKMTSVVKPLFLSVSLNH